MKACKQGVTGEVGQDDLEAAVDGRSVRVGCCFQCWTNGGTGSEPVGVCGSMMAHSSSGKASIFLFWLLHM